MNNKGNKTNERKHLPNLLNLLFRPCSPHLVTVSAPKRVSYRQYIYIGQPCNARLQNTKGKSAFKIIVNSALARKVYLLGISLFPSSSAPPHTFQIATLHSNRNKQNHNHLLTLPTYSKRSTLPKIISFCSHITYLRYTAT